MDRLESLVVAELFRSVVAARVVPVSDLTGVNTNSVSWHQDAAEATS